MEQAISFPYADGQLFGVLHEADGAGGRPAVAFVFPHSGSRGRLGCTFHYPYLARALARHGYPVLRFDPPGLGDSDGEIETGATQELYRTIQTGRYVDDTLAAIAELRRLVSPNRVVLLGICGGAITALESAAVADEVAGVALMSIPVMLDYAQQSMTERMPAEHARKHLYSLYAGKLLSPKAWWRLLTSQSDIAVIKPYVGAVVRGMWHAMSGTRGTQTGVQPNRSFFDAARAVIARKQRAVIIFGEDDRFRWEFESHFHQAEWRENPAYEALWELHLLKHCNHMLTLREWQDDALRIVLDWLPRLDG